MSHKSENVRVLAKSELLFGMDEKLRSDQTCPNLRSILPLWIIEHAWSKRMMDVLEVLGPPLWLEGNWGHLTLQDSCNIRVVSAEAWMVMQARDIRHFERVMEFLDVTHTLLPHLVTPIKHMKIMFGLKTLVIMWMLWGDQDVASIIDKIMEFFPDSLPQYHRSTRRHMELMQRTHQDFRNFAQSLARNPDMRKIYIRDEMEEQYGERYALKLEERLSHYLEELDKALPQHTYIEKVLKQPWPLGEKEELLQQLLTCNTASIPTALKRLLKCAMADYYSSDHPCKQVNEVGLVRPDLGRCETLPEADFQDTWLDRSSLLQKGSEKKNLEGQAVKLRQRLSPRAEAEQAVVCPCELEPPASQGAATGQDVQQQEAEVDSAQHLCSRHGKRMKSIVLECSEELQAQDRHTPVTQAECTPPTPPTPFLQSTPKELMQTSPSLLPDSSSTNISSSTHSDSTTNISGTEDSLSEAFLGKLCSVKQNTSGKSSVLQPSGSSSFSFLPHQLLPSSAPPSLPQSSFSASPSVIPAKQITSHHISPSPTTQSSVYPESSSSVFSFHHVGFPTSLSHMPCSSSSSCPAPAATASPGQDTEQAQGAGPHTLGMPIISDTNRALGGELKLSSETQAFLLHCKWLQPQVLLCRLSQDECFTFSPARTVTDQASRQQDLDVQEEGEEYVSFDVNLLYSDSNSESDTHDSDDPDYAPSKKLKAQVD